MTEEVSVEETDSFRGALKIIVMADFIMSLDNVLAIAGVANGSWLILIFGLAVSVPLVIFGAKY